MKYRFSHAINALLKPFTYEKYKFLLHSYLQLDGIALMAKYEFKNGRENVCVQFFLIKPISISLYMVHSLQTIHHSHLTSLNGRWTYFLHSTRIANKTHLFIHFTCHQIRTCGFICLFQLSSTRHTTYCEPLEKVSRQKNRF